MSFLSWYLVAAAYSAAMLMFITWREFKHNPEVNGIDLGTILLIVGVSLCPLVNFLAALFTTWFFVDVVASEIVFFKKS